MSHRRGQATPSLYFSDYFGVSRQIVGRDRISDFTTRLILEFLCSSTERFTLDHVASQLGREFFVPRVTFNYEVQAWVPKRFTLPVFRGDFILLTPSDLLTIVLIPDEGQLRIELRGDLAAMLTAAQQTKRSPTTGDCGFRKF